MTEEFFALISTAKVQAIDEPGLADGFYVLEVVTFAQGDNFRRLYGPMPEDKIEVARREIEQNFERAMQWALNKIERDVNTRGPIQ